MIRTSSVLLCVGLVVGCRGQAPGSEPGPGVVARFRGSTITIADVDAHVLGLPPGERPKPGENLDAWFEGQIREVVIDRELLAGAREGNRDQEEDLRAAEREVERQIGVQLCLGARFPQLGSVSAEELRAAYDQDVRAFSAPERRSVANLFLRATPERPLGACRREAEGLRDRVLRGERFGKLAARYSDSESRHRDGALGWILPGQLPGGFDTVVFGLGEGVPSDPVATRDGVHLFYVDQVLPARQMSFEEASSVLRTKLVSERRQRAFDELARAAEVPTGAVVLDRAGFATVVAAGDDTAVVLQIGDMVVTLGELKSELRRRLLQRPEGERPPASEDLAWQQLEALRRRELVFRECRASRSIDEESRASRIWSWRELALVASERQHRLNAIASADEGRLRTFFEGNIGQFSSPPRWQLRRFTVPLGDNPRADMARLERAAAEQNPPLETLRGELGGRLEDLGWRTLAEIRGLSPHLPPMIAPLRPGQRAAPIRTADALEMIEVIDRQDARPSEFDEARDRVAVAYAQQYTRELYQELSQEILATGTLEIFPEALAALRTRGLPEPEVSVEELESLLSELEHD